jgi:hypothetical protein
LRAGPGPYELNRPPWVATAAFAAAATALLVYPAWPGFMSYDSLFAYQQTYEGVQTRLWPPLHTYLFAISRALGAKSWGLFVAQTFLLTFGAALAIHLFARRRSLGWALCALFCLGVVYFPTVLGSLMVHWRDVTTTSFAVLGLALWFAGARARSIGLLIAAAAAFSVSAGLRYNALALVAPALALMAWRPFLDRTPQRAARIAVLAALVLGLGLAFASTRWRLPDLVELPDPQSMAATQEFDVIGVSACAGRNYVPLQVTRGWPITVAQLRQAYDPRHLHRTLADHPGVPHMQETDAWGEMPRIWRRLIRTETRCYVWHRLAVFREQMGVAPGEVFYPTHGMIDPNPYGLKPAHPRAAAAVTAYVSRSAAELSRRPALLYALALVLATAAAVRDRRRALLLAALTAGAFAYPALLFVAGPAADARYIFPSNILCLLICMLALATLVRRREQGP